MVTIVRPSGSAIPAVASCFVPVGARVFRVDLMLRERWHGFLTIVPDRIRALSGCHRVQWVLMHAEFREQTGTFNPYGLAGQRLGAVHLSMASRWIADDAAHALLGRIDFDVHERLRQDGARLGRGI